MIDLIIKRKINIKNELLAGLTVALALVPEAVAFAFVAGVDPSVGLWAAFIMGFCTSIFGGRPGMISGATGATAVAMTAFVILYGLEYLFAAVIMCGIIQILCGVFKLGKFVRLLPHPVMLGFVNGLAIVIGMAQFGQLKTGHDVVFNSANQVFEFTSQWMSGGGMIVTLALIVITMAIIHFLPKLTKAVPGTLVAIISVTLLVQFTPIEAVTVNQFVETQKELALEKKIKTEKFNAIKGDLKVSELDATGHNIAKEDVVLPDAELEREAGIFQIPDISFGFESLIIIFGLAITLAAIGLIESLMTLTLVDELTETRGHGNKECVGQGVGNIVSGLFGSMGGCAMIGQSMINIRSGGRTRISSLSAAVFLLFFIVIPPLWNAIGLIPIAALIGVMFIVVIATFEWTSLRLWKRIPNSDFLVIVLVSTITVLFDLAIAVLAGVIISSLVFAWQKAQRIKADTEVNGNTKIYRLNGPLFFGSVTSFKDIFSPNEDPENIIIDFEHCRVYDHSSLEAINQLTEKYRSQDKHLKLRHLSPECRLLIKNAKDIIEVNLDEDPNYHVADNRLA